MEAVLSSENISTDVLPSGLAYGLDKSGSMVTHRRSASLFALGNIYSPEGVKMIQINIGSPNEWLVPDSVYFSANIHNLEAAKKLYPASPDPGVLFERVDIFLGGQKIESITEYARCNELFTRLTKSPQKKEMDAHLGFGVEVSSTPPEWDSAQNHTAKFIDNGKTKRIFWKLNLSGLLNQHRWIPLYCLSGSGLSVQMHLAPFSESLVANAALNSLKYELLDVQCKADFCTLDDQIMNEFQEQLLSGSALRIPIKKIESVYQYLAASTTSFNFDCSLSRNYTRLCNLWATFAKEPAANSVNMLCRTFYIPDSEHTRESFSYYAQIGSKRIPDQNSVGLKEAWMRLQQGIGIAGSLSHTTGITQADYESSSFCCCTEPEKIPHLASSGENVSNVGQILLRFTDVGSTGSGSERPDRVHLVATFDALIECRDTTVEIFE